jgi:retrotransposon gag protein
MRERNTKPREDWSDRMERLLSSFNEMTMAMRQVFGDVDERTVAAQKLQNLRQDKSVREYITEFQTISSNLEWDEDALMDKFKGGLKQNTLSLLIYFPKEP